MFFLPGAATVVDFVFLGIAHDDDLAVESFLSFLDEHGEFIPDPIHLPVVNVVSRIERNQINERT